jgi:hypothetical protein
LKIIKENLPLDVVKLVVELCLNISNGNLRLDDQMVKKLQKYKNQILSLTNNHLSLRKRKHILQSGGAFLPVLLKVVGPMVVSEILEKLMKKK